MLSAARWRLTVTLLGVALAGAACSSRSTSDPSAPLTPGPSAATELQRRLIEAKPGAAGNIAAQDVARPGSSSSPMACRSRSTA